jgi:hypothetical protein
MTKEEIFYQAYQKARPPEADTPEKAIQRGFEIAANLDRVYGSRPRTPEQIYLANRDAWVALENEAHQRQLDVRFESRNQVAKNRTARVRRIRDRQSENENSTVVRFARQFGLARYRVEQIRRAMRDCSNLDLFKMAIGGKSAREVLRYPLPD